MIIKELSEGSYEIRLNRTQLRKRIMVQLDGILDILYENRKIFWEKSVEIIIEGSKEGDLGDK